MAGIAPCLWAFLDVTLSANTSPSTDLPLATVDGVDDTYWDVTEEQDGQSQGMHSDRTDKKLAVTNIVCTSFFNLTMTIRKMAKILSRLSRLICKISLLSPSSGLLFA